MPAVRDGGVVWCEVCEVCQQSETEVWCGVRCVRCANSQRQRCGVVWCEVCEVPTVRDGSVVWCEVCEVCQQSETEVWCGVV